MRILDRIKKLFSKEAQQKSWWTPYYGATFGGSYDIFGGQKEPSKADLCKAYDDLTYACVSYIAQNIAHVPIKLYVKTATGQRQPKCATRRLTYKSTRHLRNKMIDLDIREVVEHPLLDLISKCNAYHNRVDLMELSQIYLDLTGNAYWLMAFNGLGIPEQIYLLPSHLVQPERDENYFVKEWVLHQGTTEKRYSLDEIVHFKYNNPMDPYGEGLSPLRGAWSRRQISTKELGYLDNYLSNMGKPDSVLAIKDSISPIEAERIAKEFRHRYQGQGAGGVMVIDGTMNLTPLNFPAKDLSELQVYQVLKTVICNCFHIPPDIFELGTSSNRSTKEAAIFSFAQDCLTPRLEAIVQKLNDRLIPYFDDRLFFGFEPIVHDDQTHELAVDQMLISQQVITRNELRSKYGYPSEEWAEEPLLPSGVFPVDAHPGIFNVAEPAPADTPATAPGTAQEDETPVTPEQAPAAASNDLRATVGGSVAVADLQRSYYRRELPREAAIANAVLIFGFTDEEAERLFPELVPDAPQTATPAPEPDKLAEPDHVQADDKQPPPPAPEPAPEGKAVRQKIMRPLAPGPLIKALQTFFSKLAKDVYSKVKSMDEVQTKSVSIVDWFDMEAWTDKMTADMRPVLAVYYDHGAKETLANLNLTSSLFNTVQPKLQEGVEASAMVFCEETLKTTYLDIDDAVTRLRNEIAEGLIEGDVKNEMMRRVQRVFSEAETERAFRIGVTEASRGQHNAMLITAKESGVVSGKTWLLSDDACPICKPLSNKTVGLDELFTTFGTGPYAEITAPPMHPNCRCTLLLRTN